jgi:cell division protease FtsH
VTRSAIPDRENAATAARRRDSSLFPSPVLRARTRTGPSPGSPSSCRSPEGTSRRSFANAGQRVEVRRTAHVAQLARQTTYNLRSTTIGASSKDDRTLYGEQVRHLVQGRSHFFIGKAHGEQQAPCLRRHNSPYKRNCVLVCRYRNPILPIKALTATAPMDNQQHLSLWYFVAAALAMLVFQTYLSMPHAQLLAYSDFQTLLQAGQIKEVVISDDQLSGVADLSGLKAPVTSAFGRPLPPAELKAHAFVVARVPDETLVTSLRTAKVKFSGRLENRWLSTLIAWIAPAVIFVLIWTVFIRRMAGGQLSGMMDVGKSKAKVYVQRRLGLTFADVEGIDEAKEELIQIVDFLKSPEQYRRLGGHIPKGVLIIGAPGTGKTLLAKAVAGEAQVPFLSLSGSEFVEMFVGVGAARVRDLFQQAQELAPCIIFIDELDALGKSRGVSAMAGNDEREQTLNQLLVQMDGFDTRSGVIILAATNRPEILDPALLRPGRFDRHVALDRPDIRGREKILRVHAKHLVLDPGVDLGTIAARTPGFVGADLANIANEAALRAARKQKPAIEMADFEAAMDRIMTGHEMKHRVMKPIEKEVIAHHEAGHALIAESRTTTDRVTKVSIIPRGIGALGFTQQLPTEDRYLLRYSELLDRLDVLLGGRVAEQLAFGEVSTGSQNDMQRATDMARHMVMQYGMSAAIGPATLENRSSAWYWPEGASANRSEYSERTAQIIDEEIRRLLGESEQRVRDTLTAKRGLLDALARALLQQETIDRSGLLALLQAVPAAPISAPKKPG